MLTPLQECCAPLHIPVPGSLQPANRVSAVKKNKTTFAGSCHCGTIRFEVDIDPATSTRKCNCTFCTKTRFWKVFAGAGNLRVLAGADRLADYQFGERYVHHYFCIRCGVRPFARTETGDADKDIYVVNVACLEGEGINAMRAAPVRYEDGRNDDWWSAPAGTRQL